ncbi:MAG: 3-methylornithyl-N6-L-lysine dehydrogenase PylD [Thermoleophilia bacterium]
MTRLTEADVRGLTSDLRRFEAQLERVAGLDLLALAQRAAGGATAVDRQRLAATRMTVVPISAGLGFIPGFASCVAAIVGHLGCPVEVAPQPDVRGFQYAADSGAEVVFVADDYRFVALNLRTGVAVDDDPATADGFCHALDAASDGVRGCGVAVFGLGPVGRAAVRCLDGLGAAVLAVEPDHERARAATAAGLPFTRVSADEALARCRLVVDATPVTGLVDLGWVRDGCYAAVPGMPSGFTAPAQAALGDRHIHDPLAVGVAVMTVRALSEGRQSRFDPAVG